MNIYIRHLSEERAMVLKDACAEWGITKVAIDPDITFPTLYNVDMDMDEFLIKSLVSTEGIALYPKNNNLYSDRIEIDKEDFLEMVIN